MNSNWIRSVLPRIIEVRQSKGWRPTTLEAGSYSSKSMAVLHELWELEQALGARDPIEREKSVRLECADVVIYLIVMLHDLRLALLDEVLYVYSPESHHQAPQILADQIRMYVLEAWETWRHSLDPTESLRFALNEALALATCLSLDIEEAVKEKTEANALRPRFHGNKHPDT